MIISRCWCVLSVPTVSNVFRCPLHTRLSFLPLKAWYRFRFNAKVVYDHSTSPKMLEVCMWDFKIKSLWACFVWQYVNVKSISVSDEWKCWLAVLGCLLVCIVSVWQLYMNYHCQILMNALIFIFSFTPIMLRKCCCFCSVEIESHYGIARSAQNEYRLLYILMLIIYFCRVFLFLLKLFSTL